MDMHQSPMKVHRNSSAALRMLSAKNTPTCKKFNSLIGYSPNTSVLAKRSVFGLIPVMRTPTPILSKVVNPFDSVLAEHLHRPLIASPSLFHHPSTPKNSSSSQFEWTIEDVSSFGSVRVEAHETQFEVTPDPELEARAQAAISNYFRHNSIVPSPIDCPLRSQQINYTDCGGESVAKNHLDVSAEFPRTRDGICQTVMTIEPNLPAEEEELLKKFFSYTRNQQQSPIKPSKANASTNSARDISGRRKLFDNTMNSTIEIEEDDEEQLSRILSPPPGSPYMRNKTEAPHLSPSSPVHGHSFEFMSPNAQMSPIHKLVTNGTATTNLSCRKQALQRARALYQSTPEKFMQPHSTGSSNSGDCAMDLSVSFRNNTLQYEGTAISSVCNMSCDNDISFHPQTPVRSKHRQATSKNLSYSFLTTEDACHNDGPDRMEILNGTSCQTD